MTEQPSAPTCAVDAAPLTDTGWICHPCTAGLAADLRRVPDALEQLDVTLARQDVLTAGGKGNGDKPLPINLNASAAATQIRTVLHGWARCLLEEGDYGDNHWTAAGQDPAGWLGRHLAAVRMREWAGELVTELRRALDDADTCIDRREERLYAGPCGNPDSDPPCDATLWAALDATEVTCRTCGHVWDVNQRRDQLIAAAKDEWLPIREVASLVSLMTRQRITPQVINLLDMQDHIHPLPLVCVTDPYLYRVRDVLDALKHIHDHKPAPTSELVTWLRDVHDIDLGAAGQGRIRQWAVRYPADVTTAGSDSRGRTLYDRAPILALAERLVQKLVGAA